MVQFTDRDEEEFANADEPASNFDALPDGNYICRVVDAKTDEKGGKRFLTWKLEVLGGQFAGRYLWRNNMLETKSNYGWVRRDLKTCGLSLARLSEINDKAAQLVGLIVEVTQKTSGKYSNVYVNKLAKTPTGGDPVPMTESSGELHDNDEVPF